MLRAGPSGPEWDLRGLWLLDGHDRPVRPPVDGVLPPGHYPSPHRSGELEYWTVRDWTEGYRRPAVPFLETATGPKPSRDYAQRMSSRVASGTG